MEGEPYCPRKYFPLLAIQTSMDPMSQGISAFNATQAIHGDNKIVLTIVTAIAHRIYCCSDEQIEFTMNLELVSGSHGSSA
jgi:hypothetical protein